MTVRNHRLQITKRTALSRRATVAWIGLLLLLCAVGVGAGARAATGSARPAPFPRIRFVQYQLPNGLRVVLAPDRAVSTVTVCVAYDAGARYETPGHSGLAHLLEHMMFEGSQHVLPGQYKRLILGCGGTYEGGTTIDAVRYYEEVPREQLRLALFLEADRMFTARLDPASLPTVRQIVEEEKRMRHDDADYDPAQVQLWGRAFSRFCNGHQAIGTRADLDAATIDDLRAFYRAHYGPRHAAIAITGNFDLSAARAIVAQYFQRFAPGAVAPPLDDREDLSHPVPLPGDALGSVHLTRLALPRYYCAFRIPPETDPDYAAIAMLSDILGDGKTSRCWRDLVAPGFASDEAATTYGRRGPGLLVLIVTGVTRFEEMGNVPGRVWDVIRRVQDFGVTAKELARIRRLEEVRTVDFFADPRFVARDLAYQAMAHGDADLMNRRRQALQDVTAADLQRVARRYLVRENGVEFYAR